MCLFAFACVFQLDTLTPSGFVSSHRLGLLQNALGDVASYRVDGIWVGRLATPTSQLPEGQEELTAAFDRTAGRLRGWVRRDAAATGEDEQRAATTQGSRSQGTISGQAPGSQQILASSEESMESSEISAELLPLYRTLSDMREQFRAYAAKHGSLSEAELEHFQWLQYQLNHAESGMKHDGVWVGKLSKGEVPAGQAQLQNLVESCYRLVHRINVACEERVRQMKPAQPKQTSQEIKMWQEMTCQTE
jgi:hypothetical protein